MNEFDKSIVQEMQRIHNETNYIYGYRRLKIALEAHFSVRINKKKIQRLQKEHNLCARIRRKRFKYPTLVFSQEKPKKNLLNQNFKTDAPNKKWVTDITYIQIGSIRMYMSALMDLYNREIISYKISNGLSLPFVLETIKDGFQRHDPNKVIIHSDQGSHYRSRKFCNLLRKNDALQSMSRKGNCYDNASMENFFGHLKSELINRLKPTSEHQIRKCVDEYITFYNYRRIQTKIKMAPVEYRCHLM